MSGYKGKVEIDVGQTSTFTELAAVTNANPDMIAAEIEASVFNNAGQARDQGRLDFVLPVDLDFSFAEATHVSLLNAMKNRSLVDVRVYPDRDVTSYFAATCRVFNFSIPLDGSDKPRGTVNFSNADGDEWTITVA